MTNFSSVEMTELGVAGVLAQACISRSWPAYGAGVRVAPMSVSRKQESAVMTLPVAGFGTHSTLRKDDFARSGIRTPGPPV